MNTVTLKAWFQLPGYIQQLRLGFKANQIFRENLKDNWWMSYQPSAPDTKTDETALMPAGIILRGDHRDRLAAIYEQGGKVACEKYFADSRDKITEGFMEVSILDTLL